MVGNTMRLPEKTPEGDIRILEVTSILPVDNRISITLCDYVKPRPSDESLEGSKSGKSPLGRNRPDGKNVGFFDKMLLDRQNS